MRRNRLYELIDGSLRSFLLTTWMAISLALLAIAPFLPNQSEGWGRDIWLIFLGVGVIIHFVAMIRDEEDLERVIDFSTLVYGLAPLISLTLLGAGANQTLLGKVLVLTTAVIAGVWAFIWGMTAYNTFWHGYYHGFQPVAEDLE